MSIVHTLFPLKITYLPTTQADYIPFYPSTKNGSLILSFQGDNRQSYDVKAIEFRGGEPTVIHDMSLTEMGKGSLLILNFGESAEKVTLIPSVQPERDLPTGSTSSYAYGAEQIVEKVEFIATVFTQSRSSKILGHHCGRRPFDW